MANRKTIRDEIKGNRSEWPDDELEARDETYWQLLEYFKLTGPDAHQRVWWLGVDHVTKHKKCSTQRVLDMTFYEFEQELKESWLDKSLVEWLGGPPTRMQEAIWKALDGRAMKTEQLAEEAAGGDKSRMYYTNRETQKGGLREMQSVGCVKHKQTVGHYRPDSPPSTTK